MYLDGKLSIDTRLLYWQEYERRYQDIHFRKSITNVTWKKYYIRKFTIRFSNSTLVLTLGKKMCTNITVDYVYVCNDIEMKKQLCKKVYKTCIHHTWTTKIYYKSTQHHI